MDIKGEVEDMIYAKKLFINELQKVQDQTYDKLVKDIIEIQPEIEDVEDFLFDYVFNEEKTDNEFQDHLDEHGK